MAGSNDTRTPPEQVRAYTDRLAARGRPYQLHWFDGGHGFWLPPTTELITVAVRWHPRYDLSYRDVEELLAERGVEVASLRWLIGGNGQRRMALRLPAVDHHGRVIEVLVSKRLDADAARHFFQRALTTLKVKPTQVVTDAPPVYPRVLDKLIPAAWHHVERG